MTVIDFFKLTHNALFFGLGCAIRRYLNRHILTITRIVQTVSGIVIALKLFDEEHICASLTFFACVFPSKCCFAWRAAFNFTRHRSQYSNGFPWTAEDFSMEGGSGISLSRPASSSWLSPDQRTAREPVTCVRSRWRLTWRLEASPLTPWLPLPLLLLRRKRRVLGRMDASRIGFSRSGSRGMSKDDPKSAGTWWRYFSDRMIVSWLDDALCWTLDRAWPKD